jgi:hypothetical protein
LSDEDWVALGGLESDDDYFRRIRVDTGADPRS